MITAQFPATHLPSAGDEVVIDQLTYQVETAVWDGYQFTLTASFIPAQVLIAQAAMLMPAPSGTWNDDKELHRHLITVGVVVGVELVTAGIAVCGHLIGLY